MTERVNGHCYSSLVPAPVAGMEAMASMGIDTIGWSLEMTPLRRENPPLVRSDGTFDFAYYDASMAAFRAAGLKVLVSAMWLPRQWTNGNPINEPFAAVWKDGVGWYDWTPEERPWLFPPYPEKQFNSEAIFACAAALAERYGPDVAYVSCWNEPDIRHFYPQKDAPPSYLEALRPLYEQVVIPFIRGWRSKWPGVIFVGSDSSSPGNLDLFLRLEAEHVNDPTWPKYERIAYHVYPDGDEWKGPIGDPRDQTIAVSLKRIGDYQNVIRRYPAHRNTPQWVTEYANEYPDPVTWTAAIRRAFPQIVGTFPYKCSQWFQGGDPAWDAGRFEPNENYRRMHALIHGTKRRAVRS